MSRNRRRADVAEFSQSEALSRRSACFDGIRDPFQDFTKTGHVNTHAGVNFPMRRWWGESGSCASPATTAPGTFSSELVSCVIISGNKSGAGSTPFHPNLSFVLRIRLSERRIDFASPFAHHFAHLSRPSHAAYLALLVVAMPSRQKSASKTSRPTGVRVDAAGNNNLDALKSRDICLSCLQMPSPPIFSNTYVDYPRTTTTARPR